MLLSFVFIFINLIILANFSFAENQVIIKGLKSMKEDEFLYLLDLNKRETLDEERLNEGIKRLFLKNIFEDIVISRDDNLIEIVVIEKPFVREIEFRGNRYFDEKFYRRVIPLKLDDRLDELKIRKSKESIERNLKDRGFPSPEIAVERDCRELTCELIFKINEGIPQIIKKIKFTGVFDEYIYSFLELQHGDIFDRIKINEFIEKVKKYYQRRKIIGTKISYEFKDDELIINVTKGKSIEIELTGVESLSRKDLMEIINAHFQDKIDENVIRDSINSLIYYYQNNGFKDIKVYTLIEDKPSTLKINYIVNEGIKRTINQITLSSSENEILTDKKEILGLISNSEGSPFNPEKLEDDRRRIEDFLKSKGYYSVKVYPPEVKEVEVKIDLLFKIDLGKRIRIGEILLQIRDNVLYEEAKKILSFFENQYFNDTKLVEIKRKLLEAFQREGYIDSLVNIKYEITEDRARIEILVNPGERKFFGKSVILGNVKTKTKFIYERLTSKENQKYNPYILEEDRQALYRTGLFSRVDIKTQRIGDSIDVIYTVEESPAGTIEFGLGYGEYEKAKGFAEISYINLFGTNKQIFSRVELSTLEKRTYLTYIDPWLWRDLVFKSSISYNDLEVKNIDTKDTLYNLKKLSFSSGFEKKLTQNFKIEFLYEASYSKTSNVLPEVIISDQDVGKIFSSGFRMSLIYDTRDYPFDPRKGWLGGISSKLNSDFFGSEINLFKTSFYINKYTEIFKNFVLATSIRGGWIWLYGKTEDAPISERFFLGGRDTVRGYAQNTLGPKNNKQPTGGNAFFMGNLELRSYLGKNFFLVNFIDFGNLWRRVGDVHITDLKYTSGIGLRYRTPIGPIRIDYGYKLNRQRDESRGEIHFSIGHAF